MLKIESESKVQHIRMKSHTIKQVPRNRGYLFGSIFFHIDYLNYYRQDFIFLIFNLSFDFLTFVDKKTVLVN